MILPGNASEQEKWNCNVAWVWNGSSWMFSLLSVTYSNTYTAGDQLSKFQYIFSLGINKTIFPWFPQNMFGSTSCFFRQQHQVPSSTIHAHIICSHNSPGYISPSASRGPGSPSPVGHLLPLGEHLPGLQLHGQVQSFAEEANDALVLQQQGDPVDGRHVMDTDHLERGGERRAFSLITFLNSTHVMDV